MTEAQSNPRRAGIRRAVQTTCIAVRSDRFKLFGQRGFDVSADGMLVETRVPMSLGDKVMVTFQTPRGHWVQSRAEVARYRRMIARLRQELEQREKPDVK